MWIVQLEKRIFKILCITLGILILLTAAVHLYIVNNAESLIEEIVRKKSRGKVRLELKKIRFNYFSNKIVLEDATFYSVDSAGSKISYSFKLNNARLRVGNLWNAFTKKELLIDSVVLNAPEINITRLKKEDSASEKQLSISAEMGRIYNSITDALNELQVKRFEMNEGKFMLADKTEAGLQPLEISNLHLHIDNLKTDTSGTGEYFSKDQMVFRTHHQAIDFPDGKHKIAFSRFRINIRKRLIEIDSCTITGRKPGNERARFSIFLDTLKLVNADFYTLYHNELIKADSLFCRNPYFKIDIQLRRFKKGKSSLPNLDTVIQQLTGDLSLGYIGVSNAKINISSYLDSIATSSFSSDNNNFEMEGLSIDHSKKKPVSLTRFSMAIHNYMNYLQDSSYFLRFDSILLRQNKILLSNFSINTIARKDERNIKVKQFGLSEVSWSDLLFNKKIVANQAILYSPEVNYTQPETIKKLNRSSFFNALEKNNFIELEKIKVVDGEITIYARNGTSVLLKNADFVINSRDYAINTSITTNERFIDSLSFSKGVIKVKHLKVDLNNAKFSGGNNNLSAEKMIVSSIGQDYIFSAADIYLSSAQFQDSLNIISANEASWKQGKLEINRTDENKETANSSLFVNIGSLKAANTAININIKNNSATFFLDELQATGFSFDGKADFSDLKMSGTRFNYSTPESELNADQVFVSHNLPSSISNFNYKKTAGTVSTTEINIPGIHFTPDLKNILNQQYDFNSVKLDDPKLQFVLTKKTTKEAAVKLPLLNIDSLEINRPFISFEDGAGDRRPVIYWNGSDNNFIHLKNIQTHTISNEISAEKIKSNISDFTFTTTAKKSIATKKGLFTLQASAFVLRPEEKLFWKFLLNELKGSEIRFDSLGKKATPLNLHQVTARNFFLSSENTGSLKDLLAGSPSYSVTIQSGNFKNENIISNWENVSVNKAAQSFSVDSFSMIPVLSREAFVNASPFQRDYMTFRISNILLKGFDPDRYLKDSTVLIRSMNLTAPYFTSYKDKRLQFKEGIIKPLPSRLVQRIPFRFSADTINVTEGTVRYTEVNDKTGETAVIPVTHMSGDIFPIKNFGINATDSLRIRINGYLLDTGWIRLRTRESYVDTLSGFLITVRMRPHSLLYLNTILTPLAAVKLQSGHLDTITMRAIARDNYSLGEMNMHYHDLKVQFFKNDTETKKLFLQGFKTFIANSLVIRNSNTKRKAIVYFPRIKDRSFINYYIKTFMSGVASAIGAKSTRKMLRKYQKEIKKRNLPPVDFD
jgi:hypothetical protein